MKKTTEHISQSGKNAFVEQARSMLEYGQSMNKLSLERLAKTYEVTDRNEVKEFTELAISIRAREIARQSNLSLKQRYDQIVSMYKGQARLSQRTSQSILNQQYSTPAPIGFLMGMYCKVDRLRDKQMAYEPSAGNGLLTILADPSKFWVNEIDPVRNSNLKSQGFYKVTGISSASPPVKHLVKRFDVVITNPPFGKAIQRVDFDGFKIDTLDHQMAIYALETMKDKGRAAIIIGGHTAFDSNGRIQKGKNRTFFNYLYKHYKVDDVIPINGQALYSRQGTSFNTRLILIAGRKKKPEGFAPVGKENYSPEVKDFQILFDVVNQYVDSSNDLKLAMAKAKALELEIELELEIQRLSGPKNDIMKNYEVYLSDGSVIDVTASNPKQAEYLALNTPSSDGLGAAYIPSSKGCFVLNVQVPDSMSFETHSALHQIEREVGGDFKKYVAKKLDYPTTDELCKALAAEQIDSVALAIYNIEARGQGLIIGDQTGIGKGRQAAAMIRYGIVQGMMPIFITEKDFLFTDLYRDMADIGFGDKVPFIVNARSSKTDIKDKNGNVVYRAPMKAEQDSIMAYYADSSKAFDPSKRLAEYDYIMATYSQFASGNASTKRQFLLTAANGQNIVLDESHNASGASKTGAFLMGVVKAAAGVTFLSATFAKRPDNMPLYAVKTAMQDANMTDEELITAIEKGGVALQEILSSQLVKYGQMVRRERGFEDVEVNYIVLDEFEPEHRAIADSLTELMRGIIEFQNTYIAPAVKKMDKAAAKQGLEVEQRQGTSSAGVSNTPYFNKLFNVINQMLFSVKSEQVAHKVIKRLEEGYAPVIAFSSTMGAFLDDYELEEEIATDFSNVLIKGLDSVRKITVMDAEGNKSYPMIPIEDLGDEGSAAYYQLRNRIIEKTSGLNVSPIDRMIQIIEGAGYSVAEVTGRSKYLALNKDASVGRVMNREKLPTTDQFRLFNQNKVDVLMINQSGSTGASAHAVANDVVPESQVKPRVMVILQAELDINREVQKRGRINRTGQIHQPTYDYIHSAIPAEKRLMMMLKRKLKSLDANTSSNQKNSEALLESEDFFNKIGDKLVVEWLKENEEINKTLNNPLKISDDGQAQIVVDAANKVAGKVAVLPTEYQEKFYNEVLESYRDMVSYLKEQGEYDLEVEELDLQAEQVSKTISKVGRNSNSPFGSDTYLQKVKANALSKPFTRAELTALLDASLDGKSPEQARQELQNKAKGFFAEKKQIETDKIWNRYQAQLETFESSDEFEKYLRKAEKEGIDYSVAKENYQFGLRQEAEGKIEQLSDKLDNQFRHIDNFLSSLRIGQAILYRKPSFDDGVIEVEGLFIGWDVNFKKDNPFAPSAIKAKFALVDSSRKLNLSLSGDFGAIVNSIIANSHRISSEKGQQILDRWDELTSEMTAARQIRYIISGNILQGFDASNNGKLVSYTTLSGTTQKGILMPAHFGAGDVSDKIIVPLSKSFKILQTLPIGKQVGTADGSIFFYRDRQGALMISVRASNIRGGMYYKNEGLLDIVRGGNFEQTADRMKAALQENQIQKAGEYLSDVFKQSLALSQAQFDSLNLKQNAGKEIELAKAKAKALEIEIEIELEIQRLAA